MIEWLKTLLCCFTHRVDCTGHAFRDKVSGEDVYSYHCQDCNVSFLATSRFSTFRVLKR